MTSLPVSQEALSSLASKDEFYTRCSLLYSTYPLKTDEIFTLSHFYILNTGIA